jgi:CDP-paratose 2-epimerase
VSAKTILVAGSSGLIGSEAVAHFDRQGHQVHGIDNNMRAVFLGDTWKLDRLRRITKNFTHHNQEIRDSIALGTIFRSHPFDLIIHCAAQTSHDKARDIPILDFEVNALGTVNLLESTRLHCPEAVFIPLSTNKVYGDPPDEVPLKELESLKEAELEVRRSEPQR